MRVVYSEPQELVVLGKIAVAQNDQDFYSVQKQNRVKNHEFVFFCRGDQLAAQRSRITI